MKRFAVLVSIGVITLAPLSGCEQMAPHETAMQGLRVFCALYRSEVIPLSPQQAQAASIVCTMFNVRGT